MRYYILNGNKFKDYYEANGRRSYLRAKNKCNNLKKRADHSKKIIKIPCEFPE